MSTPTRLIERAVRSQLAKLDDERDFQDLPIDFPSMQEGNIYIHRAYQSWMKVIRDGRELPQSAVDAAIHMAAAASKYAGDLMSLNQQQLLQAAINLDDLGQENLPLTRKPVSESTGPKKRVRKSWIRR